MHYWASSYDLDHNTLDDPGTYEVLDLIHSAGFRSLTGNHAQVDFFETGSTVSNGT
jgi:hypothetical protein